MLKGLALTPPTIGRISIGKVVERNGKRLPEKDNEFTITSQLQTKEGWIPHPIDEQLRKDSKETKLRNIPIKLLFNDPDLNFRCNYTLFDRNNGRPVCVGDGETCKRITADGLQSFDCPSPTICPLAQQGRCKPYGRLNVRIGEEDELGSFIYRTTGFNSIRTLSTRLKYFDAVSGGLLATMPLELRLRGKSTVQSFRQAIYYVDLTVIQGLTLNEAIEEARAEDNSRKASGFNQKALDDAARIGFSLSDFEDTEDECGAVIEEFYPDKTIYQIQNQGDKAYSKHQQLATLEEKLMTKAEPVVQ